ncbi:MAG: nucleotidyltransferase domain-containing protein [Moorea sp. SIO3I7]|uniref:Nucleotidyltransferase n=1 Tax=Moorena bouillonii PNG TaxID=568701 RepID=A0A1U7MZH7_9CYAN|nr:MULTISPECIES: nucleotidyltransferase domain-containing protein [Moorena]NEO02107.1 nucleotidyltransferase domain-containing protein [Moorena sp. SIO3I7]NEO46662.1 nucleotidyltransferase domain-containing protein [Moorena sp. SIO4A3]NEO62584.1 nucleotidyltransferase domain-containing protein [Moorena sp. SIO4G2]NEO10899.1 nucleotidyltransferase domain-containing protein [Moorena sp. SIO3E8]NEP97411.1 nucleotidyltransferase domain-containing protein [Moorena sp. SIO3F7]
MNPHLILPVGTQVVTRVAVKNSAGETLCVPGAVGVIVKAPTDNSHGYRVRLSNDREVTLPRHEFSIRKHFQKEGLQLSEDLLTELNLYDHVIYRCVVGSRAFGLDDENSDTDRRGIYLPPAVVHWSLYGIPEQLENHETQECYWELQKFIILALKANPNVLECLYTPLVETATPLAEELLGIRDIFLSKLVYQTYNGYVMSQFKKMEQDFRTKGAVRLKHAMHLIRLLLSGITVLKEGFVPVKVEAYRQQLLAIRRDEMPWEEVTAWRLSLHQEFDAAFANTNLPERPDYEAANGFLIKARQSRVYGKGNRE